MKKKKGKYRLKNSFERKVYFWNALGGIVSASTSVIIIMVITHTTGTYDAGIFSLGYANAMLFSNIGTLDTRSHQCANAIGRFSFSDYYTFRVATSFIMIFGAFIFVNFSNYSAEKSIITILMSFYCAVINISDIFQGNAQIKGRLDLGGQSLAIRGMLNLFIFTLVYIYSQNLILSIIIMTVSAFIWIITYDKNKILSIEKPRLNFSLVNLKNLLYESFPLGICLTLQVGIFNIPKYAIDRYLVVDMQTIYSIIFMPAFIVNLFGIMIYRPILVKVSLLWKEGKEKEIKIILRRKICILILITIIITGAGYLWGPSCLSILYGVTINPYRKELLILLLGGGFTGMINLLYFVVTVAKRQYLMLGAYLFVFLISCVMSFQMVKKNMLMGAAESYLLTSIILNGLLIIIVYRSLKQLKHEGIIVR